jgi:hypothetical protein
MNTITGQYEPVKNVEVKVSRLLRTDTVFTDENGYFEVDRTYRHANIKLYFRNDNARVISSQDGLLNFVLTTTYSEPTRSENELVGIEIKFNEKTLENKYATIIDAVEDYKSYAIENNIALPPFLRIMAIKPAMGMAFMGRYAFPGISLATELASLIYRFGESFDNPIASFIGTIQAINSLAVGLPGAALLHSFVPDIFVGTEPSYYFYGETELIQHIVYHELAHASHFVAAGPEYWRNNYVAMLGEWIKQIPKAIFGGGIDPYGENPPDLVKLIESWAYFVGYHIIYENYSNRPLEHYVQNVINRYEEALEDNTISFYNPAFYKLKGDLGYSVDRMFLVLSPTVVDHIGYVEGLINKYGGDEEKIKEIFEDTGLVEF